MSISHFVWPCHFLITSAKNKVYLCQRWYYLCKRMYWRNYFSGDLDFFFLSSCWKTKGKGPDECWSNISSFKVHLGILTTNYTKTNIYINKLVTILFCLVLLCMCMCLCAGVHMCEGYTHMCTHVCGGQNSLSGVFLNHSPSYFLRQVHPLSVAWSPTISKPQDSSCLCFTTLGLQTCVTA